LKTHAALVLEDGRAFVGAALGADVIEKHFTFSRLMYGSDAANSMEPADFRHLAGALREVWRMRDCPVDKDDLAPYHEMKLIFEKSVVTARPVVAGATLERADLAFKKPGDGISAARYGEIIGRRVKRDLPHSHKLAETDFA